MTAENKTVAELLESVKADAYRIGARLYFEQPNHIPDYEWEESSRKLVSTLTIERVVRRALTNRDENIAALNALLVQKDIENANLSRAVAELTETKADFYRSGVADGRAQKEYELDELRAAVEHRESQGLGLYVHSEPDTLLQVAHRMACKLHPEKSHLEIANELAKHNHQQPSVNEELFVVAQQHPSRPEVSMFTANAKVAEEYKRIGWTVLKIDRAEAAKKEPGK